MHRRFVENTITLFRVIFSFMLLKVWVENGSLPFFNGRLNIIRASLYFVCSAFLRALLLPVLFLGQHV